MNWFAKMIFDEGGSSKNLIKSRCRLCKISNTVKQFGKQLKIFPTFNRGSILIEFAVCMPVLIILLYYINDLSKMKRYYDQTEFVAMQMANILQNVSRNRENKRIDLDDLKYTVALAYQTIYPGKTMYWQKSGNYFVHVPHPIIYYVEGNNDGTATAFWGQPLWTNNSKTISPSTIQTETRIQTNSHDISLINMGTLQPSQIYSTLKIGPGDKKIIVETPLFFKTNGGTDINGKSGYTSREVFGLRAVSPKQLKNKNASNTDMTRGGYFNSVVIFSPKNNELFDTNPPSKPAAK